MSVPLDFLRKTYQKLETEYKKIGRFSSADKEYWINLKNRYVGRRGFIIGNGPSLSPSDLEKLKNEITIASNKIYLIFDKTTWRPTIYTVADHILWPKINEEALEYFKTVHIPNYLDAPRSENVVYWRSPFSLFTKRFSGDMSYGAYGGHTVTFENIQIAYHLGLNPIYLIGCDHSYSGEGVVTPGIAIRQSSHVSHFHPNYRKEGEIVMPAAISKMESSYSMAKKYIESRGGEIYNATRGGKLEIFNRVDLDKVIM